MKGLRERPPTSDDPFIVHCSLFIVDGKLAVRPPPDTM
jgi:hypothetical protein